MQHKEDQMGCGNYMVNHKKSIKTIITDTEMIDTIKIQVKNKLVERENIKQNLVNCPTEKQKRINVLEKIKVLEKINVLNIIYNQYTNDIKQIEDRINDDPYFEVKIKPLSTLFNN